MSLRVHLVFLLLILVVTGKQLIKIDNGLIVGEKLEDFYAYRGIPYAESPVGELRFSPPKPYLKKWDDVREFVNYSDVCAQYDHFSYSFTGIEDCLNLNVFVPKNVAESNEKVPVIFFIHGGAFMFGGGKFYLPENIMKAQNMILVTVNYRLGILGFLSTEDKVIPGNFGLKDQVEALRWVQRNIGSFNGDKDKVTIVGYSAGGASVQLHYMSSQTDGLFNNGISHSGVALNPWVMVENSREKAHQIANFMNCPEDHESFLSCLRDKPAEDLVVLAKKFQPFLYNPFSPFGVVVEASDDETAFLTDDPKSILEKGNFKRLPWFLSQTQDEGLYPSAEFYNDEVLKTIDEDWNNVSPFILDFNGTSSDAKRKLEISSEVRKFYLKDQIITKKTFGGLLQMITDRLYHDGAFQAVQLQSNFAPTYFYHFRFAGNSGVAVELNAVSQQENAEPLSDYLGVSHGDDVFLIYFNPGSRRNMSFSAEEKKIGYQLMNLYYDFASDDFASYGNMTVYQVLPKKVNCLEIFSPQNFSMKVMNEEFGHVKFWSSLNIKD